LKGFSNASVHCVFEVVYIESCILLGLFCFFEFLSPFWAAALTKALATEGLVNNASTIRLLLELIAGLDRRVPQVQRAGEAAIALDAAALKAKAFARIAELEQDLMKSPAQ